MEQGGATCVSFFRSEKAAQKSERLGGGCATTWPRACEPLCTLEPGSRRHGDAGCWRAWKRPAPGRPL